MHTEEDRSTNSNRNHLAWNIDKIEFSGYPKKKQCIIYCESSYILNIHLAIYIQGAFVNVGITNAHPSKCNEIYSRALMNMLWLTFLCIS